MRAVEWQLTPKAACLIGQPVPRTSAVRQEDTLDAASYAGCMTLGHFPTWMHCGKDDSASVAPPGTLHACEVRHVQGVPFLYRSNRFRHFLCYAMAPLRQVPHHGALEDGELPGDCHWSKCHMVRMQGP